MQQDPLPEAAVAQYALAAHVTGQLRAVQVAAPKAAPSSCPSEPTSFLRFSGEGCSGRACTAVGSSKGEGRWRPQSSADSASLGSESSEARDVMSSSSWRQQHRH